jgi:hypothetical protein
MDNLSRLGDSKKLVIALRISKFIEEMGVETDDGFFSMDDPDGNDVYIFIEPETENEEEEYGGNRNSEEDATVESHSESTRNTYIRKSEKNRAQEAFYASDSMLGHEREVFNIKYGNPVYIETGENSHVVYQRIIIRNGSDKKNAHDVIVDALSRAGIQFRIADKKYEGRDVKYIESIDGRHENIERGREVKYANVGPMQEDANWEILVDGKFAEKSIDQTKISRYSTLEIRRKSGCAGGGTPDALTLSSDPTVNKNYLPRFISNNTFTPSRSYTDFGSLYVSPVSRF